LQSTRSTTSADRCKTSISDATGYRQQGTGLATCFWWSACRSTRNPHQPKRVRSVREKRKGKRFHKKEFPENVVSGGIVVRDAQQDNAQFSLKDWHSGCTGSIHQKYL
jgi:hypothetical protein